MVVMFISNIPRTYIFLQNVTAQQKLKSFKIWVLN